MARKTVHSLRARKICVEVEGHFAEPADVRANPAAAFAAWNFGGRVVGAGVVKGRQAAGIATALEQLAVHVDDAGRAAPLVEIIDVLRAEKQAVLQIGFELGERAMAGIRFGGRSGAAAHGVELPHQSRVAAKGFGRPDFLDAVGPPQAARATERRNAAFGADARAGEDEDAVAGGNPEHTPEV